MTRKMKNRIFASLRLRLPRRRSRRSPRRRLSPGRPKPNRASLNSFARLFFRSASQDRRSTKRLGCGFPATMSKARWAFTTESSSSSLPYKPQRTKNAVAATAKIEVTVRIVPMSGTKLARRAELGLTDPSRQSALPVQFLLLRMPTDPGPTAALRQDVQAR